jgi:hypothetical protein
MGPILNHVTEWLMETKRQEQKLPGTNHGNTLTLQFLPRLSYGRTCGCAASNLLPPIVAASLVPALVAFVPLAWPRSLFQRLPPLCTSPVYQYPSCLWPPSGVARAPSSDTTVIRSREPAPAAQHRPGN